MKTSMAASTCRPGPLSRTLRVRFQVRLRPVESLESRPSTEWHKRRKQKTFRHQFVPAINARWIDAFSPAIHLGPAIQRGISFIISATVGVCVCVCVRGQLFICFVDGRRQLLSLRLRRTKGAATGPSFTAHTFPRLPLVPRWVTCSTHNNNNDDDADDDDDGKQKNETQNGTGRQNNNKHSAITRPSFPFAGYPLPPTDQSHSDEWKTR